MHSASLCGYLKVSISGISKGNCHGSLLSYLAVNYYLTGSYIISFRVSILVSIFSLYRISSCGVENYFASYIVGNHRHYPQTEPLKWQQTLESSIRCLKDTFIYLSEVLCILCGDIYLPAWRTSNYLKSHR